MSTNNGLTRADESKLHELKRRQEKGEALTEDDELLLSYLSARYSKFLDDGVRKLRETSLEADGEGGAFKAVTRLLSRAKTKVVSGSMVSSRPQDSFASPAESSVSEADFDSSTPTGFSHWSWITECVVAGAIPYGGKTEDPTAHLLGLKEQLALRGQTVAMVVSCLEDVEVEEPSLSNFAQPKDWETVLQVSSFMNLSLPRDVQAPVDVPFEETLQVCKEMHEIVNCDRHKGGRPSRTIYLHCKAGKSRTWLPLMCYLVSQVGLSFEEAEKMLRQARPVLRPSDAHRAYVHRFLEFVAPLLQKKVAHEEQYSTLLAQLLSLPPEYRSRLLRDLQKLT